MSHTNHEEVEAEVHIDDKPQEKSCVCLCTGNDEAESKINGIIENLRLDTEKINLAVVDDVFSRIFQEPSNGRCVDCDTSSPDWASIGHWFYICESPQQLLKDTIHHLLGYGILCCLQCAGKHRSFGTHVTLVRSIKMDDWSQEQLLFLETGGNAAFREYVSSKNAPVPGHEKYYLPEINYYREILRSRIATCTPDPYDHERWINESPTKRTSNAKEKPTWIADADSSDCMVCNTPFTFFFRKHHCRRCGRLLIFSIA